MNKVLYKTYEPNHSFEEFQAQIYNDHLKRHPHTSFAKVSAEKIKERIKFEKKDPKMLRFALREDGSPLAYIQASIDGTTSWIGFPWAYENCPKDVQKRLYDELFTYITEKYPTNDLVMGYFSKSWEVQNQFALDNGYQLNDTAYFYTIDPEKIQINIPNKYSARIGDIKDLGKLIELSKIDPGLIKAFPSDEAREHYFKNRVLPDGNLILVFDGDILVAASAPLRGFYVGHMFRFTAIRPKFEDSWKVLATKMAKHCKEIGWTERILITSFDKWNIVKPQISELDAEIFDTQMQYKFIK